MALRTGTFEVDPISRIEGHLGVKLTTTSGRVTQADVHGNLWRGFENFLLGRNANDAITFTQRICGVCPVPHGQTSTYATDAVLGYSRSHITFVDDTTYGIPAKAVLIRNLVLSAEFLMSHLTHFYHLVALDYVQGPNTPPWTPFFADSFYHALLLNPSVGVVGGYAGASLSAGVLPHQTDGYSDGLWDAAVTQYVKALRIRRLTFEAGALFAGRMPMTSCFVGGGVSFDGTEDLTDRIESYRTIMTEVGKFIFKEHVPLVLALGALYANYDNLTNALTLETVKAGALWGLANQDPDYATPVAQNTGWGAGVGNFVAWGAFPQTDDSLLLPGGVKTADGTWNFTAPNKTAIYNSFLGDNTTAAEWTADGDAQLPQGDRSMATNLTESIANSHYAVSSYDTAAYVYDTNTAAKPGEVTRTKPARSVGYSYIKSPRWAGKACEVGPFARMVVAGLYKVDGTLLLSSFATANMPGGVSGYDAYAKSTGLDPAMVAADLAIALVREGLANVDDGTGTVYGVAKPWNVITVDYDVEVPSTAAAEALYVSGNSFIVGIVNTWIRNIAGGLSVMDRLRGRALEALYLVQRMIGTYTPGANGGQDGSFGSDGMIDDLLALTGTALLDVEGSTWKSIPAPTEAMSGYGATEAPRGALAHFCSTNVQGKIVAYQCVVPTTWNASPKDGGSNPGPMEKAMENIPFDDPGEATQQGLEALRVAHTFDPCIACAVH